MPFNASRSLSDHDEGETITRRRSDELLKDDELTLAVIRNIASLSSNSATGIVIIGGLVSCK
jgi:hypothetical protein